MLIFDQLNRADKQLRVLAWLFAVGLSILLAGLWWVQVVRSRSYAEDQRTQSYRTVRVPAPRGKILDRNGVVLAENRPAYNVSLYLEDRTLREAIQQEYKKRRTAMLKASGKKKLSVAEQKETARASRYFVVSNVVAQLASHLGAPLSVVEKTFHQHYEQRLALPMPILSSLNETQLARLQERSLSLPGVDMEIQPLRVYPLGSLASHVLGYLTYSDESAQDEPAFYNYRLPDYRGQSAIEYSFDAELRGKAGAKSVLVNNLGYRQSETVWSAVEAGNNVTLTIDTRVQRAAEQALRSAPGVQHPVRGAAVVLDVRTGEILAMASAPDFDPNKFVPRISREEYREYNDTNTTPMLNRAVFGGYHPGSTFKIIVALAALEAGVLNPTNIYRSEGVKYVGRRAIGDTAGAGNFDFRRAFIKSSNPYFIDYGLAVGHASITAVAERLQFGRKTGIPLGQDSAGLLPTPAWARAHRGGWSEGDTANLSIGQGDMLATPLQLAVAIAAVANGGRVLQPQLVADVSVPDALKPATATTLQPIVKGDLGISRRNLDIVRAAMVADVEDHEGSGKRAKVDGYRVCGKTGTAQVFRGASLHHYDVWFAAYAPYDDPRYAVVVMAEYGSSGGVTCAPVAQKIFTELKYRDERLGVSRSSGFAKN